MENSEKIPTLLKKIVIEGVIIAESGIMIGGSGSALEIGGTDKQVVRNPITKLPYIPGSSLKGKMRSLLELSLGNVSFDGGHFGPTHNPNHVPAKMFGHINRNTEKKQQPSRLIVRDSELLNVEEFKDKDTLFTEIKAENSIDRLTAFANPRFFERVPKGAIFEFSMILNVFEKEDDLLPAVFYALKLVQDDYLGGSGSRGNGKVSFKIFKVEERDKAYYEAEETPTDGKGVAVPTEFEASEELKNKCVAYKESKQKLLKL